MESYDSMGRRAFKKVTVNGSVTLHQRYVYRGYLQIACIDLTRSHHPVMWLVTWDPTQPVATRPLAIRINGTWYTYGWDLTKNICELFGASGYIATVYTYSPFGEVIATGSVTQPVQWSSEYYDEELKMTYYNFRHYNAFTSGWLCRDFIFDYNLYNYVSNTPFSIDYLGLTKKEVTLILERKVTLPGMGTYGSLKVEATDDMPCCETLPNLLTIELVPKKRPEFGSTITYYHKEDREYSGLFKARKGKVSLKKNAATSMAGFYGGMNAIYNRYPGAKCCAEKYKGGKTEFEALHEAGISLNNDGIMIHSGQGSTWSGGCVIIGTKYSVQKDVYSVPGDVFIVPDKWKKVYKEIFGIDFIDKNKTNGKLSTIIGFDLYKDSYKAMWKLVQFINCASKNGYSVKWELRGAVIPSTSNINWVVDNM